MFCGNGATTATAAAKGALHRCRPAMWNTKRLTYSRPGPSSSLTFAASKSYSLPR